MWCSARLRLAHSRSSWPLGSVHVLGYRYDYLDIRKLYNVCKVRPQSNGFGDWSAFQSLTAGTSLGLLDLSSEGRHQRRVRHHLRLPSSDSRSSPRMWSFEVATGNPNRQRCETCEVSALGDSYRFRSLCFSCSHRFAITSKIVITTPGTNLLSISKYASSTLERYQA